MRLGPRAVSYDVAVTPADLTVTADDARLAQVVANLLDNAARHSPAGGTMHVRAAVEPGDRWSLTVTDEGPGIPTGRERHVFTRFRLAGDDDGGGGTGLGLAIASWVCELHGGTIAALPAEPGSTGARIRAVLPRTPDPAPTPPSPSARPSEESAMSLTPAPAGGPAPRHDGPAPRDPTPRHDAPGAVSAPMRLLLRVVLGTLCLLTVVVVASALLRMSVYQQAFGFTVLRVLVDAFELWLGLVVVLVMITGIRWSGRWLPRAALVSGAVFLVVLGLGNTEAWIAERNIERYQATGDIDTRYLATLSADAAPTIAAGLPTPLAQCALWSGQRDTDDLLSWNLARARAAEVTGGALSLPPAGSCP